MRHQATSVTTKTFTDRLLLPLPLPSPLPRRLLLLPPLSPFLVYPSATTALYPLLDSASDPLPRLRQTLYRTTSSPTELLLLTSASAPDDPHHYELRRHPSGKSAATRTFFALWRTDVKPAGCKRDRREVLHKYLFRPATAPTPPRYQQPITTSIDIGSRRELSHE